MATEPIPFAFPPMPEAEETVRAIYQGDVDAVVIQGREGPQIVTLRGTDEPYRVIVNRMSEGALTAAQDGTVLFVNDRLVELSGKPAHDIVGRNFAALFTGEMPGWIAQWTPPAEGERCELTLSGKGGTLPVSVWCGPIALGDTPATLITIADLSAHRRAEEIAAAERFARSILEQATDAIVVLDGEGTITHASLAAEHLAASAPRGQAFSAAFPLETAADSPEDLLERFSGSRLDALLATRPVHGLEVRVAHDSGGRTFLLSSGPLQDESKRVVGSIVTLTDISARKRAEEQQTTMVAELNHRVKNILAIVQSIASQTLRKSSSMQAFNDAFSGRLRALAIAHDLLTKTRWKGVELSQLLREALGAYQERLQLSGDPVMLAPLAVVPLSMVLHELMTNAAKYGALSTAAGVVTVEWRQVVAEGKRWLELDWAESGGPPVIADTKSGFGSVLMQRVTTYDLEGTTRMDFAPGGFRCELRFPLASGHGVENTPASATLG